MHFSHFWPIMFKIVMFRSYQSYQEMGFKCIYSPSTNFFLKIELEEELIFIFYISQIVGEWIILQYRQY